MCPGQRCQLAPCHIDMNPAKSEFYRVILSQNILTCLRIKTSSKLLQQINGVKKKKLFHHFPLINKTLIIKLKDYKNSNFLSNKIIRKLRL